MNEIVLQEMKKIIKEDFTPVPKYAFTTKDIVAMMKEAGLNPPHPDTIRRRLSQRVEKGELICIREGKQFYYIPKSMEKNMQIDTDAILGMELNR